ncbi:MAG TPA: Coenzyme F420 hydrogenase/dehydrogenase, beta subunit C-terminal domain [Allosphingosinicella sp.]|jgi:coenzyme F420-reducing hydrogenase beta subunit
MQPSPEIRAVSPRDIVRSGLCIGCGSCASAEPQAEMQWDAYGQLKPAGPADWYNKPSEAFSRTCPFSPAAADEDAIAIGRYPDAPHADRAIGRFEEAYVGHAAEPGFRERGSSGGMVSWVAAELLRTGQIDAVAHVSPADPQGEGRFFRYRISRSMEEIGGGAKSRYYPIELSDVLREIRATPGRYAVIGIPCFIKAINLLRENDPVIRERVTHTLGLFCGHMKSARMVESFAWQLGTELEQVRAVDYRIKDPSRPANWYRAHLSLQNGEAAAQDWWHLVDGDWGAGFFQNSACNFCDDVVAETADIAFGDAWVEPYSSDGRGTNVVIVRSPELNAMVQGAVADGRLALDTVDAAFVEQTQAAGFRHRREGLSYRLTWWKNGIRPRKRVAPNATGLPMRRRFVYRARAAISAQSHRVFAAARIFGLPRTYILWGGLALKVYQGLTYSRGRLGALFDRIEHRFGSAARIE